MFLDNEQQDEVWSSDNEAYLNTASLREMNIISDLGRVVEINK